ncbi:MAG: radical SAM family heme chaperone HemW [Candidatus Marinimicrobia bacterium]|nr:radical SAM family heme chaperone HemW [Candidatus Neomarinimicrobiota bacterium]
MKSLQNLYLYFHFPFCLKKCHYCDFYSICTTDQIPDFRDALLLEMDQYAAVLKQSKIKTIYFGGGSPNLISSKDLVSILSRLKNYNDLADIEEFTIEINPGEISAQKLVDFANSGVNRISLGAQSFIDDELKFLGRIHNSQMILTTIDRVRNSGIRNLSLDLIYGIPGQNMENWQYNLDQALGTSVDHFSFYNLIYEPETPLTRLRNAHKLKPVNENLEFAMFQRAHKVLEKAGYHHYEISNWAQINKESKHNSAYWEGSNYLGFGPSAHSLLNGKRWSNVRSVDQYCQLLTRHQSAVEAIELLDKNQSAAEFIMLKLRRAKGLSVDEFQNLTHRDFSKILEAVQKKFDGQLIPKYAELKNNNLVLSLDGWFICDYIVQEIFNQTKELEYDYKKNP